MRSIRLPILAAAAAAALVLGGCGAKRLKLPASTYPVEGPIAIDVESFNGDVFIEVDERLDAAQVQVKYKAKHGAKRRGEAKDSLADIDYTADLVPGALGPVLEVRTLTSSPEPYFQRAVVRIQAPAVENVRVVTSNGKVYCTDIQGTVDIRTTRGDVRVLTSRPMVEPVTITNEDGDIDYRIRAESEGQFECRAVGGEVRVRAPYGRWVHRNPQHDSISAVLNGGENPISLRTVDGDVRVAVVPDPTHVGLLIFE